MERKFLVNSNTWVPRGPGSHFQQGYLNSQKERVVRVRIEGSVATLTIMGLARGRSAAEFEYGIPVEDAGAIMNQLCERPLIDKHRHVEHHLGRAWEIDVYHGDNEGLVMAEVELPSAEAKLELPPWVAAEVSDDPRYLNPNLLKSPYVSWAHS